MKRIFRHIVIFGLIIFGLCSCSEDNDFVYPNLITELGEMRTDKNGNIQTLAIDNGA